MHAISVGRLTAEPTLACMHSYACNRLPSIPATFSECTAANSCDLLRLLQDATAQQAALQEQLQVLQQQEDDKREQLQHMDAALIRLQV